MSTKSAELEFKVVVLGTGGVGKSAICQRFVSDAWSPDYDPTIEDRYKKRLQVSGIDRAVTLNILDTAGQAEFSDDSDFTQYTEVDAFIMVYSVTSEGSYHACNALFEKLVKAFEFKEILTQNKSIAIVANKGDIAEHQRQVTKDMGKALSKQWHTTLWFETSAKENVGISALFDALVQAIAKQRQLLRTHKDANDNNTRQSRTANHANNKEQPKCCSCVLL